MKAVAARKLSNFNELEAFAQEKWGVDSTREV